MIACLGILNAGRYRFIQRRRGTFMAFRRDKTVVFAVIPLLAAGGVMLDILTPLGVADWVWYFIPLLLAVYVGNRFLPYVLAAVFSLLTLGGFFLSSPGIDPHLAFMSRLMGIGVQWLMAFLISQRKQMEQQLAETLDINEKIISEATMGMLVYKASGQCVLANEAAARTLNATVPELLRQNFRQIESWRVSGMLKMAEQTLDARSPNDGEFHFTSTFGKDAWLVCHFSFFVRANQPHLLLLFNNVIERKKAEEILATEQRLLNSLIAATPDHIYFKDRESRFTRTNEAFARRHGLSDPNVALGKTDFDLFGEQHARQAYEDEQRIITTGQPMINQEEKEDWKDGRVTWVSSTKMPLRGDRGNIVGIMGISRDITERKRAEEKNLQLAAIVKSSDDAIIGKTLDGIITNWNKGAEKIYGYKEDEVVGRAITLLIPADHENEMPLIVNRIRRGEQVEHYETMRKRKDGSLINVAITVSPVKSIEGETVGASVVARDISLRKRAEETLRKSEQQYRELVEHANSIIVRWKHDGEITFLNEFGQRFFGYSAQEILGRHIVGTIVPEAESNGRDLRPLLDKIRTDPKAFEQNVNQNMRRNGERVWIAWTNKAVFDQQGQVREILSIGTDITERKEAEKALSESQALYHSLVEQLPAGVFRKDAEGRYVFVNSWFCRLKGVKAELFLGKKPQEVAATELAAGGTNPANINRLAAQGTDHHQQIMQTGRQIEVEEHGVDADGQEQHLYVVKSPIFGSDGKIVGTQGILFDITGRKQTEEALRDNEAFLNTVVENIPHMIFVKDAKELRFLKFNKAGEKLLGYSRTELVGKNDYDLFPKELADRFTVNDRQVLRGKAVMDIPEEPVQTRDQGERIVHTKKIPVFDNAGRLVYLLGISEDITERKEVEAELSRERDLWRTLLDNSPDHIYFKDSQSRFIKSSKAQARQFGVASPDEMVGKTDFDFFAEAHARPAFEDEQEIIRTGQPIIGKEEREVWNDGHVTWASSTKMPMRDNTGKIVGIMGVSRDITERKQAEEHIREQAALLDKAQDAIMVMDLEDRVVFWNKSAERIYGWNAAEAIGKTPVDLFLGGAVSPRHAEARKTIAERGEWSGELQEVRKDGRTVTVQGRCNVLYNEQGRPKGRLIINTDVTEKKKLEAQFLRAQRMESLGTLAGGIAHDLNNVLTPLLVSVQVLKEKVTDDDGKRLLQSLETNVQRGAGLVKQVLAFGRGMEGERIVIHPKHIAREIKQMINETFPKSVAFELHTAPDLWTITGDPTQLHQILLNLSVNARDAMPDGGKLSLDMENVVLDEAYAGMNLEARPGPHVCFTVSDTGTGIPKEIQEKIFDPFFTTKAPGKGTGLGLSTTLAIVKSHGGFIHCYSEPGKGSTFKVYLPANPSRASAENVAAEKIRLPQGHNKLVLVVDDEEPIRKLAQKALERYGYRVLLAADGTEAVSLYMPRQSEIDVVITDMAMPKMDGLATITALKSINPDIKIVGSSGLASDGGVAKAMAAGIKHFIPKPYTAETMLLTLHEVLNGKH